MPPPPKYSIPLQLSSHCSAFVNLSSAFDELFNTFKKSRIIKSARSKSIYNNLKQQQNLSIFNTLRIWYCVARACLALGGDNITWPQWSLIPVENQIGNLRALFVKERSDNLFIFSSSYLYCVYKWSKDV